MTHRFYRNRDYIFNKETLINEAIKHYDWDNISKEDCEKMKLMANIEEYIPQVTVLDEDTASVRAFFWNDWSGFNKETITAHRKGKSVVFDEPIEENIVHFDCGILF